MTLVSVASIQRDTSLSSPEAEKSPPASTAPVEAVAPVDTGSYPAFPGIGEDAAPFLNAMFGVFQQAMAPPSAPAWPVGPLTYSLPGFQMPLPQAY